MKNLFKFLFLFAFLSFIDIGTNKAYAQPTCTNFTLVAGLPTPHAQAGKIVPTGGGNYAFEIAIMNNGPLLNNATINLSISTTEFTINPVSGTMNLVPGLNAGIQFPITSNVSAITTTSFAVPTVAEISAPSFVTCETAAPIIYPINTTNWGCTDPMAVNYDPTATFDNGTCLESICDELALLSISIGYDATLNPVLKLVVQNNGTLYDLDGYLFPDITSASPSFAINETAYSFEADKNGGFDEVEFGIIPPLSSLVGSTAVISGSITVYVPGVDTCVIPFAGLNIDISNLGCTDANAFNYDQYATVDNETCVEDIDVIVHATQPICEGDPGSVTFEISGGTKSYSINTLGKDTNELASGNYTFILTDNTPASIGGPIVKPFDVNIVYPPAFEGNLQYLGSSALQCVANGPFSGWYYFLLDGVVIDSNQTGVHIYSDPGIYTCFVETNMNALGQQCWDYSNPIELTQVNIDEFEKGAVVLYPNPTTGSFIVEADGLKNNSTLVSVYSIDGKGLFTREYTALDGKLEIDVKDLANGMYYIQLDNSITTLKTKFIKE
ncbi:MAG: T9SS type A sorting domain-containing protein [Flavobacteriales bacterium]